MDMIIFFIFTTFLLKPVQSDGEISLRLTRFENPGGKGANGHCCDGRSIFCEIRGCDHFFTICLDRLQGNDEISSCAYGSVLTDVTKDKDSIDFSHTIGDTENPIIYHFFAWQDAGLYIKVLVEDDDGGLSKKDFVDFIFEQYAIIPSRNIETSEAVSIEITGRTTLTAEIKVYCNEFWYGAGCETYCQPRNTAYGHYECDEQTGAVLCHKGWTGRACADAINECASSPCANGRCADKHDGFTCSCYSGFTGVFCEYDIDECAMESPCESGQCVNTYGAFKCTCAYGYTGETCDEVMNFCLTSPCMNNGTCVAQFGGFSCVCAQEFTGIACDMEVGWSAICDNMACGHNSSCVQLSDLAASCIDVDRYKKHGVIRDAEEIFNMCSTQTNQDEENHLASIVDILHSAILDKITSHWNASVEGKNTSDSAQNVALILENRTLANTYLASESSQIDIMWDCNCFDCHLGSHLHIHNRWRHGNHNHNFTDYIAVSYAYHNSTQLCFCGIQTGSLEPNQETNCEISNNEERCECPWTREDNIMGEPRDMLCAPYSKHCPHDFCNQYTSCFPSFVYGQSISHLAEDRHWSKKVSKFHELGYETGGIRQSNDTGDCVCLEIKDGLLEFCDISHLVEPNCDNTVCLNGGTCVMNIDIATQETSTVDKSEWFVSDTTPLPFDHQSNTAHYDNNNIGELSENSTKQTILPNTIADTREELNIKYEQRFRAPYCSCKAPFSGDRCERVDLVLINICASYPCQNNGTCVANPGRKTYAENYLSDHIDTNNIQGNSKEDYTCLCNKGFTGTFCENDASSTSGRDINFETQDKSSAFIFAGKLTDEHVEETKQAIARTLVQQGLISRAERVHITHRLGTCTSKHRRIVSVFVFEVKVENKRLEYDIIDKVFSELDDLTIDSLFPVPLSHDAICEKVGFAHMQLKKKSWFAAHWYVVVLPGFVLLTAVTLLAIMYRRNRSQDANVTNRITERQDSTASQLSILDFDQSQPGLEITSLPGSSPTSPHPMCFKNELYDYLPSGVPISEAND